MPSPGVKKRFIKREALRLLRTNSILKLLFEEKVENLKKKTLRRSYPESLI